MEKNGLVITLISLVLLLAVVNSVAVFSIDSGDSGVSEAQVKAIVGSAVSTIQIPAPVPATPTDLSGVEERIADVEYALDEDQRYEDYAENFSALEFDSRDFKKAVFDALVAYSVSIDSYKDITDIQVVGSVDSERVSDDEVEVEYSVKVFYFLDGDESEEGRARLVDFVITVSDLDHEDDFSDAEVDDSYLSGLVVSKVYD